MFDVVVILYLLDVVVILYLLCFLGEYKESQEWFMTRDVHDVRVVSPHGGWRRALTTV